MRRACRRIVRGTVRRPRRRRRARSAGHRLRRTRRPRPQPSNPLRPTPRAARPIATPQCRVARPGDSPRRPSPRASRPGTRDPRLDHLGMDAHRIGDDRQARPPGTGAPSARTCPGSRGRRGARLMPMSPAASSRPRSASDHGTATTGSGRSREPVADHPQPQAGDRVAQPLPDARCLLQPLQRARRADPDQVDLAVPVAPLGRSASGSAPVRRRSE